MNWTLSAQIKAIQEARAILKNATLFASMDGLEELDSKLNDAGSSLAAMNFDPESKEKRINELTIALKNLVSALSDQDMPEEKVERACESAVHMLTP